MSTSGHVWHYRQRRRSHYKEESLWPSRGIIFIFCGRRKGVMLLLWKPGQSLKNAHRSIKWEKRALQISSSGLFHVLSGNGQMPAHKAWFACPQEPLKDCQWTVLDFHLVRACFFKIRLIVIFFKGQNQQQQWHSIVVTDVLEKLRQWTRSISWVSRKGRRERSYAIREYSVARRRNTNYFLLFLCCCCSCSQF